MYHIHYTKKFQKYFSKILSSGKIKRNEIEFVVDVLSKGDKLPKSYQDHKLQGEYEGYRDCHIRGNLILIYKIEKDQLILILIDLGSHSKLF